MNKTQLIKIKRLIINEANYKEMEEIIYVMRERKKILDLKKEAIKREKICKKIKDK
ncbi:hypothetical protein ACSFB8_12010 [Enterococcus faecalis]